jgi:hypothetical protein
MDYTELLKKVGSRSKILAVWLDSHEFADGKDLSAAELASGFHFVHTPARQKFYVAFTCRRCHHVVIYDTLKDDFGLIALKECK